MIEQKWVIHKVQAQDNKKQTKGDKVQDTNEVRGWKHEIELPARDSWPTDRDFWGTEFEYLSLMKEIVRARFLDIVMLSFLPW